METKKILIKIGKVVTDNMRKQIESNGSNHTGKLSKEITFDVPNGKTMTVTLPLYGKFVDEGTKGTENGNSNRKMPPISKIKKWARNHGLNEYAVATNIKKYGTKPHPFIFQFNKTIQDYRNEIEKEIGIEIGNDINKALKQTFKEK